MDIDKFLNKHWFMYHRFENEFLKIDNTIPIDLENFETFSYAYIRILASICAEFNECFKNFSKFNGHDYNSINQYKQFIIDDFPDFFTSEITFNKIGCDSITLYPFKYWDSEDKINWWEINNNLKHNRNELINGEEIYKCANQINILNALSGLFQLDMYFYKDIIENSSNDNEFYFPMPQSKIFYLENWGNYKQYLISSNVAFSLGDDGNIYIG